MKNLSTSVAIFASIMLIGCAQSEPSDYALKGAAAMSDPNWKLNSSGETDVDKLELSQKKCIFGADGKTARCAFILGGRKYAVNMILTGNAWTYKEVISRN